MISFYPLFNDFYIKWFQNFFLPKIYSNFPQQKPGIIQSAFLGSFITITFGRSFTYLITVSYSTVFLKLTESKFSKNAAVLNDGNFLKHQNYPVIYNLNLIFRDKTLLHEPRELSHLLRAMKIVPALKSHTALACTVGPMHCVKNH